LSGPLAFVGSRFFNNFSTPSFVNRILAIGVISPSSLVGISPGGSSVNTDWYCLFSAAAFCLGVDSRLSFSFSVGILLVLLLLLLLYE
jgi:hypothetical protein